MGIWNVVEPQDLHRVRRSSLFDALGFGIVECLYLSPSVATDKILSDTQTAIFDDTGCRWSDLRVQFGFYDDTPCPSFWIAFDVLHFRHEKDHFKKIVDTLPVLCGNGYGYRVPSPVFGHKMQL